MISERDGQVNNLYREVEEEQYLEKVKELNGLPFNHDEGIDPIIDV